jgi:hypothetical protein
VDLLDNDSGHQAAAPSVSRRTLLGAAGALGIAATAFRVLPAQAAAAAASTRSFLGSNADVFADIKDGEKIAGVQYPGVPRLRGIRMYGVQPTGTNKQTDHIRNTWPTPPVANPGPIVYSIYPVPEHVFSGSLNKTLESLIASAPPNSYLTAWHEALSLPFPKYINSANMFKLHAHLNAMTKGTHVTYGSMFGGPRPTGLTTLFKSVPPNLGFYGLDLYETDGLEKGLARLEQFITQAKLKDTKAHYPKLMLPECNTHKDVNRPEWFTRVCERMHRYGSHSIGVLTFWKPGGPLGGKWEPTDKKTIAAMNNITTHIF